MIWRTSQTLRQPKKMLRKLETRFASIYETMKTFEVSASAMRSAYCWEVHGGKSRSRCKDMMQCDTTCSSHTVRMATAA